MAKHRKHGHRTRPGTPKTPSGSYKRTRKNHVAQAGAALPAAAPGGYKRGMPKIHVLPPETARLIAAGEVIDRPAAVLREFLDNALDAGATDISVEIEGGGVDLVRVVDNGEGMDAEDLGLAVLPHATSKISRADDLLTARSLGFRGEALASIAAAARLEITSRDGSAAEAHRLTAGPHAAPAILAVPGRQGTIAQSSRLFEDYPARRQFLKRAQAEAALCRQVFLDKALAHPEVAMRFMSEGRLAFALRPAEPEARVVEAYDEIPAGLAYRVRFSGPGCSGSVVIASPAFCRNDRRLMQVFVNRRRVQDAGLLQALDYAFEGFLPGGTHPAAFLFAEVDPALADFNIHPAKREVRLKDQQGLRHAFVEAVKSFLLELSRKEPSRLVPAADAELGLVWEETRHAADSAPEGRRTYGGSGQGWPAGTEGGAGAMDATNGPGWATGSWDRLGELRERVGSVDEARLVADGGAAARPGLPVGPREARYLGKVLGLFLVVEAGDALYLIDQHAAHERLLYDAFMASPPASQDLLVPAVFEPEDDAEAAALEAARPDLEALGFGLEKEGGSWLVTALPSPLDRDPVGAIREILERGSMGRGGEARGARSAALATAACRAAVKDGDELEPEAAAELARRALALPEPRCPHGRPVWVRLSREELFRLVRRLV